MLTSAQHATSIGHQNGCRTAVRIFIMRVNSKRQYELIVLVDIRSSPKDPMLLNPVLVQDQLVYVQHMQQAPFRAPWHGKTSAALGPVRKSSLL